MAISSKDLTRAHNVYQRWASTASREELREFLEQCNALGRQRNRRKKGNGKGKGASQRRATRLTHEKGL